MNVEGHRLWVRVRLVLQYGAADHFGKLGCFRAGLLMELSFEMGVRVEGKQR